MSSDNSTLMRNIRRHENSLEGAIVGCCAGGREPRRLVRLGADLTVDGQKRRPFGVDQRSVENRQLGVLLLHGQPYFRATEDHTLRTRIHQLIDNGKVLGLD